MRALIITALCFALLACKDQRPSTAPPTTPPTAPPTSAPTSPPVETNVWGPAAMPEGVASDEAALALLAEVRDLGIAGHFEVTRGVYWKAAGDGAPQWLTGEEMARAGGQLQALLARASKTAARCQMGLCLLADGDPAVRWFVRVRPRLDDQRFIAGVFVAGDAPGGSALFEWYDAIANAWREPTMNLIGEILGDEESGNLDRALQVTKRLRAADPDNPWALYYRARIQMANHAERDAFQAMVRLAHAPNPQSVFALEQAAQEPSLLPLGQRPVVKKLLHELSLTVPTEIDSYVAYLLRFRASLIRLQAELADETMLDEVRQVLLDWHLVPPTLDPERLEVRWMAGKFIEGLIFERTDDGRLRVVRVLRQTNG